jgi:hypothetical protein
MKTDDGHCDERQGTMGEEDGRQRTSEEEE